MIAERLSKTVVERIAGCRRYLCWNFSNAVSD
jgi:hypothetical protein